jgi:hypothetical protein
MNNNTVGFLVGFGLSVGMAGMAQAAPMVDAGQNEQVLPDGPVYMTADMLEYGIAVLALQA